MSAERTYTIAEIAAGISEALETAFPERIWVVGEIQGLDRNRHGRHWYFQLCETRADGEVYRLSATIWNRVQERLFGPGGTLSGIMDLSGPLDGMKIRALCRLDFYPPYGKISLHVEEIDPTYTLGDLEARRQALLEKLRRTGALERNKARPLPEVPIRVGLVTSLGSAAYNDFMKELERSRLAFKVFACDARMQGEETAGTVRAAFATLEAYAPDVIAVVRGGGSRLDLSWFDREEVVAAVVTAGRPVITGIGHEIDVTVFEMAAHTGLKTPTAAAAFLVDRVQAYLEGVRVLGGGIAEAAVRRLEAEREGLRHAAREAAHRAGLLLSAATEGLAAAPGRLCSAVRLRAAREGHFLSSAAGHLTAERTLRRFEAIRVEIAGALLRAAHGSTRILEGEHHFLELMGERLRLLDPVRVLDRGYALLQDEKGHTLKSVRDLCKGARFSARLRDGRVGARVESVEEKENDERKEKRQLEIW